ncbi:cadherin domain-containing protein [Maricaulis sp.]|uniref:cadherin domain-containing protein n=1 Tax=Maricaulis sp. TaxID=1486257 RepID=UPI002602D507|nr:cadherin domain-containing protein [Maricaulis sp.]
MAVSSVIARQKRASQVSATALILGAAALFAPQAEAQEGQAGFRPISEFDFIDSYTLEADGSARLVLSNGRVVTLSPNDVSAIDGDVRINPDAVEAPVSGGEAAAGGGGAMGGVALGGLLALGAAAGGGGGGGGSDAPSTPNPTPTPTNRAPVFTSETTATVAENTTSSFYTATATDADNDTLTYSISGGADQSFFTINSQTGALSFTSSPDFDINADADGDNVYEVTIRVSDGTVTVTQTVNVTLTNVDEGPVFSSGTAFSVDEDQTSAFTASATDPEGASVTYSIRGTDAALFTVNANTGVVSFISAPDFDAPGDANGDNVYVLEVVASDGGIETVQTVSVTVDEVVPPNNVPVFTSGTTASVAENSTAVFYTATATDGDSDPLTYSISGGADAALFTINGSTGELSFISGADFDVPADANGDNIYNVTIQVSDGQDTASQSVAVTLTNVDEAPVFSSGTSFNVDEDQTSAFTAAATDPEGASVTYSIRGTDAALFTVNANTGVVSFVSAPDFDAPGDDDNDNVYELEVVASDGGIETVQAVTVTVDEVTAGAPTITSAATSTVSENQTSAYETRATDPNGDTLTYSISGTDAALFQINSATGEVSFRNAPDFEAPGDAGGDNVYNFTVTASDGSSSDSQNVAVTVTDSNDVGDVPDNSSTTVSMVSGGSYIGNLETDGDQDWIRVELVAGQRYEFNLFGSGGDELDDPYIRLYDSSGTLIAENDDISLGVIVDSRLGFTVQTSGTYYISAGSWINDQGQGTTGEYTLTVAQTDPLRNYSYEEIGDYLNQNGWNGAQWNISTGGTLTVDITGLTAAGQNLARAALQVWTDATGILFNEVSSGANIVFSDDEEGAFAGPSGISGGFFTGATVNVGTEWLDTYGTNLDGYSFQTYIHEIGHALGLGHAGPYDGSATYGIDNIYLNDSWQGTVMSYFSQTENTEVDASFAYILTPMLGDLAAVADMYGLNPTIRTGDTTYGFNSNAGNPIFDATAFTQPVSYTVIDAGGTDTFDFSGSGANQVLDLRASSFSSTQGLVGNIGIAATTVIENAIGGSGSDTFIGNAADNVMTGNGGNDIFYASGGNDSFDGGAGANDQLVLTGTSGDYNITTNGSGNTVYTDLRSGSPDGVIEIISIESVVFGGTIPETSTMPLGVSEVLDIGIVVEDFGHGGCACSVCKHTKGEGQDAQALIFEMDNGSDAWTQLTDIGDTIGQNSKSSIQVSEPMTGAVLTGEALAGFDDLTAPQAETPDIAEMRDVFGLYDTAPPDASAAADGFTVLSLAGAPIKTAVSDSDVPVAIAPPTEFTDLTEDASADQLVDPEGWG